MRAVLQRKGAREDVVDRVVEESFRQGLFELAKGLAMSWLSRRPPDRSRLARHLERKGYPAGTIARVLADEDVRAVG